MVLVVMVVVVGVVGVVGGLVVGVRVVVVVDVELAAVVILGRSNSGGAKITNCSSSSIS